MSRSCCVPKKIISQVACTKTVTYTRADLTILIIVENTLQEL